MIRIKVNILIVILLILITTGTQAQTITKEIGINITETKGLEIFYVPIDRFDQFLALGEE